MKCPICNINLIMSEKQGIEIDYCPDCRGIWLDRGELEKIIERSAVSEGSTEQYSVNNSSYNNSNNNLGKQEGDESRFGRKRNFFSELFD